MIINDKPLKCMHNIIDRKLLYQRDSLLGTEKKKK